MENSQNINSTTSSNLPDSSQNSIYTRCVNDDSDGSILSDWMSHDSDREENLKEVVETTSQYLLNPNEESNEIREVQSEYAFDINSY
ncbi:unnamed protein product [Caenorhabditis brenneri]